MKRLFLFLFIFLFTCFKQLSAQQQPDRAETFIKVWGFLKYYHTEIAKGKIDWDESFRNGLKEIKSLNSKQAVNNFYLNWIDQLGEVEKCGSCKTEAPKTEKFNLDMGWLKDSGNFSPELIEKLTYIQKNRNQKPHHYIGLTQGASNPDFKNEKTYTDSIYPSPSLRLLTLARYWNMINYFFPYRYQTTQPWDKVLTEMAPKFESAKDTTDYHLAIMELIAKVDDSHAKFSSKYTNAHFGLNWVPFKFSIIDDKAVVTGFFNDTLSRAADIRIGDAFTSIEGKSISQLIAENSKYIGASNTSAKLRDIHNILFHGNTLSVETEFERDGKTIKKSVPRYPFKQLNYKWGQDSPKDTIKVLEGNIGYVHMGNLTTKSVPTMIQRLKETRAIIFDLRAYPQSTLYAVSAFLNDKREEFVMITTPDTFHPGTVTNTGKLSTGGKNKNHYQGKVILLCNENTQSQAEFTIMALQTAPNAITIGSETSGADGNVSQITLPGNLKTYMSGLGIFYPDGTETQRIGIKVDITAHPTIKGVREGRDEVLEKAFEVIGNK